LIVPNVLEPRRRRPRDRSAHRHQQPDASPEAVPLGQPTLSVRRARLERLGGQTQRRPRDPINWKPYLDKLPNDPWGQAYQYLNPGIKGEVDVLSFGADRQSRRRRQKRRHWQLAVKPSLASCRPKAAGFTLLELLVVLAIIASASAAVVLSMRDSPQTRLQAEAERVIAVLEATARRCPRQQHRHALER
jgi:prepilin-type N-terminal cleavage/methylation domain-containing protein